MFVTYLFLLAFICIVSNVGSKKSGNHTDICLLPKKRGYCLKRHPRFYYHSEANECKPFTYSGCRGNDNRFRMKEDCERRCKKQNTTTGTSPTTNTTNKSAINISTTTVKTTTPQTTTRIITITKSKK